MPNEFDPSPFFLLRQAIKAVPAVKYAMGIGGIVAVIAIIAGYKIDFRIAVFGVVIMLVLMTVLVVFAHLSTENKGSFHVPALVFMWFALLLTMAIAVAVFTSVFWGHPVDWTNVMGAPRVLLQNNRVPLAVGDKTKSGLNAEPSGSPATESQQNGTEKGFPPIQEKADLKASQGTQKPQSLLQPKTLRSTCCGWIVGRWHASVDRAGHRTESETGHSTQTCAATWTENYEISISVIGSAKIDGTVGLSIPNGNLECHTTDDRDGIVYGKISHDFSIDSAQFPLNIAPSDIPNRLKITINNHIDWIVEKSSDTEFFAICLYDCNMSLYAGFAPVEGLKRLKFEKF